MEINFNKQKVLITGSSKGIGFYIAKKFINLGAIVSINSRNKNNLNLAKNRISSPSLHTLQYDLSNKNNFKKILKSADKIMGGLDILICNLGYSKANSAIGEEKYEDWIKSLSYNLISSTQLIVESKKYFKKSKNPNVVCIGSIAGSMSINAPISYSSSKAALIHFVKNQSKILSKSNIRINMVSPGNVFFPGGNWDKKLKKNPIKIKKYINQNVPLNRFGNPEEIADAVIFLASNKSMFTTGSNLVIDGGQSA